MTSKPLSSKESPIQTGNSCLLCATDRHFLVEILDITDNAIYVSFPVKDFLVSGMSVVLEFHEADGYFECSTKVIQEPKERGDRAVLRWPEQSYWNAHRDSNRVATDLTVHVRDVSHPRRYDADLINVSTGGALVRTRAPLGVPDIIELTLSLPGEPLYYVKGRILHLGRSGCPGDPKLRIFGIQFVDLPVEAHDSIARYITEALVHGGC